MASDAEDVPVWGPVVGSFIGCMIGAVIAEILVGGIEQWWRAILVQPIVVLVFLGLFRLGRRTHG